MAKFDIKTRATKPLYAGVGVTDLAVGAIREYVSETQKRLADVQKNARQPQALRDQAVTRVDALAQDARARRAAMEKRVAELQADATATVTGAYDDLVSRGEGLVTRIRRQKSSQDTAASARTTTTKAKTVRTQAATATKSTARKTTRTAKRTAAQKSAPAKSSAKATTTAAKQTVANAAQATTDAAAKVGD